MDRYSVKQKLCKGCGNMKKASSFYRQAASRDGLQYWCKKCQDTRKRKRQTSAFYRKHDLKKKFGMTQEDYKKMLDRQNGLCAICENQETTVNHRTKKIQNLAIDHCHTTGAIRGLLCSRCNNGLGRFKDNVEYLKRAITYLQSNEPTNANNGDVWVDTA